MVYVVAMGTILSMICDYGFNWTGVQEIAAHRDDKRSLSRIVSNILAAKLTIYLLCCSLFIILLFTVPKFRANPDLYALSLVIAAANASSLTWFIQGVERMAYLALVSVSVRGAGVIIMLIFISGPSDVPIAIILTALPSLAVNILMLLKVRSWISGFCVPTRAGILHQLRLAWTVFSSSLVISAYTQALVLFVGSIGGVAAAAHYGLAERLLNLGKAGISVSYQAAMPQASYFAKHQPEKGLTFITRHVLFTIPLGLVGSIIMLFFGEPIVKVIASPEFVPGTVPLFKILSPVPLILSVSSSLTTLYMLNYGLKKQWSRMLIVSCILALLTFGILQLILPAAHAAAWASVAAESTVFLFSIWFYIKGVRGSRSRRYGELPASRSPVGK